MKYVCEHCGYGTDYTGSLKRHLADKHNIGVTWYHCPETDCDYKTKQKGHLKRHQKTHDPLYIARQKAKETKLANYLQKHFDIKREHYVWFCHDTTKSHLRLDFIIIRNGTLFIIECDEFQHRDYEVSCENSRISNLLTALVMNGNTLPIFLIRFNPDGYKVNGVRGKVPLQQRYDHLKKYIENTPTPTIAFSIHYMYYDTIGGRPTLLDDTDYHLEKLGTHV